MRTELSKIIQDAKDLEESISMTLNGTCLSYVDHQTMANEVLLCTSVFTYIHVRMYVRTYVHTSCLFVLR